MRTAGGFGQPSVGIAEKPPATPAMAATSPGSSAAYRCAIIDPFENPDRYTRRSLIAYRRATSSSIDER